MIVAYGPVLVSEGEEKETELLTHVRVVHGKVILKQAK